MYCIEICGVCYSPFFLFLLCHAELSFSLQVSGRTPLKECEEGLYSDYFNFGVVSLDGAESMQVGI